MNIKKDLIPISPTRRPGIKMDWDTITVHNTGNPKSTAENERAWLTNPQNSRQASWHYVIKEDTIIQAIPDNEVAWHAGDGRGPGNMKSIGIEICETGDLEHSKRTAAKFIAAKLKEKGKDVKSVKQHYDWSGKDCPRLLRPVWPAFIAMIQKELDALSKPAPVVPAAPPVNPQQWKVDIIKQAHEAGLISDLDKWLKEADEPMPAWAAISIALKLYDKLGGK